MTVRLPRWNELHNQRHAGAGVTSHTQFLTRMIEAPKSCVLEVIAQLEARRIADSDFMSKLVDKDPGMTRIMGSKSWIASDSVRLRAGPAGDSESASSMSII